MMSFRMMAAGVISALLAISSPVAGAGDLTHPLHRAFSGPEWQVSSADDAAARGAITRVLLVGDSWAYFMNVRQSLRRAFMNNGYAEFIERGDGTTILGSTAAEWNTPTQLATITSELAAYPTIDVVHLSLGGNDFLAGQPSGGWYVGMSAMQEEALFASIIEDILAVADHCLAQRPEIKVVIGGYDYPNFVNSLTGFFSYCPTTFADLGMPTPAQVNAVAIRFEVALALALDMRPDVFYFENFGQMQYAYGYPDQMIEPGTLIPPGDVTLPTPRQAMFLGSDCIHLRPEGYDIIGERAFDLFYEDHFLATEPSLSDAFIIY